MLQVNNSFPIRELESVASLYEQRNWILGIDSSYIYPAWKYLEWIGCPWKKGGGGVDQRITRNFYSPSLAEYTAGV